MTAPSRILEGQKFHQAFAIELDEHSVLLAKMQLQNIAWINAEYGKETGDEVIAETRAAISGLSRAFLVGEISPTLYGIVCLKPSDPKGLIGDIDSAIAKLNREKAWPFLVELAFGVVVADKSVSTNIYNWISQANTALAVSSRSGHGAIYNSDYDLQQEIRLEFGKLTENSEPFSGMSWVYQPLVRVVDGSVVGYETLVRWNSPKFGVLSPDLFIPIAEDMGVIHFIDKWALHASRIACRTLLTGPEQSISVNVSAKTFEHAHDFVEFIDELVSNCGPAHGQLVLELTETAVIKSIQLTKLLLNQLRERSIKIAVDDFGKGETNLLNIATLPIDYLKIDKSLLRLPQHSVERSILQIASDLGRSLGMQIIAEGVEDADDLAKVQAVGVDLAQGFHLGKPEPLSYYLERE